MLPIHRWAALTVGLLALVSAFTGAGMVFRKQLDPIVYPRAAVSPCAAPILLDALLATAEEAHPRGKVDYLRILRDTRQPVEIRWMNKDTLYVDRCTGKIVAQQNRYAGIFGILEWIHRGRWLPEPAGDYVMGLGAINLLFLLLGVGLYLWWPRKKQRFRDNFKLNMKLRKGPPFDMGLHRTIGGWVAIALAISASTALPNAFPFLRNALAAIGSSGPAGKVHSTRRGPLIPISAAWSDIEGLTPNPREALIHVAHKPSDPLEIYIIAADAPHANARTYLYLDSHDGHILKFTPYADMGLGDRLYYWMLSIHTGEVGGVFGQLLLAAGAIGALVLGFTGIRTWFRRRANRSRVASKGRSAKVNTRLAKDVVPS
jgi:vanillate O-demethylase ferredoxin subunit